MKIKREVYTISFFNKFLPLQNFFLSNKEKKERKKGGAEVFR